MTQDSNTFSAAFSAPRPRRWQAPSPAVVIALVALAATGGLWLYQQQSNDALKAQLGRELAAHAQRSAASAAREAALADRLAAAERNLTLLSARQAETQGQQATLNALYDALTRNETQRVLAELEQTLSFASQQLQLAGNVSAALVGLESIEAKLAQLDRPELIPVRKAVMRDIDRLKSQPYLDVVGISAKLDHLVSVIDRLPLAVDGQRQQQTRQPVQGENWLQRLGAELWQSLRELVRIREMDQPEAMLLTPEQAFFLRENVKLRLLDARTALLLRSDSAFRADLDAAAGYLARYFDNDVAQARAVAVTLKDLSAQSLAIPLPSLAESLAAVRTARSDAKGVQP
ncbi:uroporphyrinogen-III C-methyltransferase [Chitiniphilus purpureus]|uniref:Uroporphyrinogen-III C-methyltransferase n=1 Tax=Chitiniphilus purpureus TaxID=2981137 RepID=A0ABY6DND4_9NEIS|nr:uroporphyrinogen-III C-methyltransferase [Chitiniphilus sp. CD1]UXY15870.1 uroporphyrinogen-III C-methyltransferase [Chitiniphilus sp. CD1]